MKYKVMLIGTIFVLVVIAAIGFKPLMNHFINEQKYKDTVILYTKIENEGIQELATEENKDFDQNYEYMTKAIGSDGKVRKISFYGINGKPLKKGTYLKVWYSDAREVVSWEVVEKNEIPSFANEIK